MQLDSTAVLAVGDPRLPVRFWSKVRPQSNGCWLWTAGHNQRGYPRYKADGRDLRAHRVAFERLVGPIPSDLELDHLCLTPGCVNPGHLEAVTHHENVMRGNSFSALNAAKTHCPQGHLYDAVNTAMWHGWRFCRACRR